MDAASAIAKTVNKVFSSVIEYHIYHFHSQFDIFNSHLDFFVIYNMFPSRV